VTSTDRVPTPGDWHDPKLAGIAEQVRPVVNAGKARALAFEIVRLCLALFSPGDNQAAAQRAGMVWLFHALHALTAWHARALDIDSGEEAKRPASERLTLLDVAGAADRIASIAWCHARAGERIPLERWIVFDLATALRRACGCIGITAGEARSIALDHLHRTAVDVAITLRQAISSTVARAFVEAQVQGHSDDDAARLANEEADRVESEALRALGHSATQQHDHTARTLLPLLIRDVRALLAAAHVDASAIEAAIVAHGGAPS